MLMYIIKHGYFPTKDLRMVVPPLIRLNLNTPIIRNSIHVGMRGPIHPMELDAPPPCCRDRGCPKGGRVLPADHAGTRRLSGKTRALQAFFLKGWEGEGIEPCKICL